MIKRKAFVFADESGKISAEIADLDSAEELVEEYRNGCDTTIKVISVQDIPMRVPFKSGQGHFNFFKLVGALERMVDCCDPAPMDFVEHMYLLGYLKGKEDANKR